MTAGVTERDLMTPLLAVQGRVLEGLQRSSLGTVGGSGEREAALACVPGGLERGNSWNDRWHPEPVLRQSHVEEVQCYREGRGKGRKSTAQRDVCKCITCIKNLRKRIQHGGC